MVATKDTTNPLIWTPKLEILIPKIHGTTQLITLQSTDNLVVKVQALFLVYHNLEWAFL